MSDHYPIRWWELGLRLLDRRWRRRQKGRIYVSEKYRRAVLADNPVAYWPLDDSYESSPNDC